MNTHPDRGISEPVPEIEVFAEIARIALEIQQLLDQHEIRNWLGGGLAVDLLKKEYLPTFQPRAHKDIDFYIPVNKRPELIALLKNKGFTIDNTKNVGRIDIIQAHYKGNNIDFISIYEPDGGMIRIQKMNIQETIQASTRRTMIGNRIPIYTRPSILVEPLFNEIPYNNTGIRIFPPEILLKIKQLVNIPDHLDPDKEILTNIIAHKTDSSDN